MPQDSEHVEHKPPPGLVDSLKGMLATVLQLVHTRVELFTTELEEEMHRISQLLLWSIVTIFFGGLFFLMLALTVVIALWDEHRLLAALGVSLVFLAIVLFSGFMVRARLKSRSRLLETTVEELKRDREKLRRSVREHGE